MENPHTSLPNTHISRDGVRNALISQWYCCVACLLLSPHRLALDHNDGLLAFDRATAALEEVDDDVELHTFVMQFAEANEERLAAHFAALD